MLNYVLINNIVENNEKQAIRKTCRAGLMNRITVIGSGGKLTVSQKVIGSGGKLLTTFPWYYLSLSRYM